MRQCTQTLFTSRLTDMAPVLAGWVTDWDASPKWDKQCNHATLYYVRQGCFTLVTEHGSYPVKEGQAFFISATDTTTHTVGEEGAYSYCWVGFNGTLSHRLAEVTGVFDVPEDQLEHLKDLHDFDSHTVYDLTADLLRLRSWLLDGDEPKRDYVQQILDHIQSAYMYPITVESLAAQVGLDRSYLSRLFKQKTGQTLQEHLQFVRIRQAKALLIQGCSIKEAAYQCGFCDDKNFHKVFLRRERITPNQWKKCVLHNLATMRYDWPEIKEKTP